MSKIAIMEGLGISAEELAMRKKPFEEKGHVFADYPRTTDVATLIEQGKDADAFIIANMPMPADVIRGCEALKFIDVAFTGVDHVALDAAKEKGVAVSNASGYSNEAVAELVLGMALNILRNVSAVEARCRAGATKDGLVGSELKGKTVGIIGFGKIGRRSAELFNAFGCRVLAQSRTRKADAPDYVEQVEQDELLKASDIVVLRDMPEGAKTASQIVDALVKEKGDLRIVDLDLDADKSRIRYEGEAEMGEKRYEFEMDVFGNVTEWERD